METKKIMSLDNFPEWQKATEKSGQLIADIELVRKKIHNQQVGKALSHDDRVHSKALLLLGEDNETPPPQEELASLLDQEHILRTAQAMQSRKLSEIRGRFSDEVCREVKPQYVEIVKRLTKAAVALQGIVREERNFQRMLHQAGVECSCRIPEISLGIPNFDEKVSGLTIKAKNNTYIK